MNLSWAKSFAKTALLEAQKRVDQVLEIAEGEEDEEEEKVDDEQEPEVNEEVKKLRNKIIQFFEKFSWNMLPLQHRAL
jgi:hypothetical protein